jgi:hypothetical protein
MVASVAILESSLKVSVGSMHYLCRLYAEPFSKLMIFRVSEKFSASTLIFQGHFPRLCMEVELGRPNELHLTK